MKPTTRIDPNEMTGISEIGDNLRKIIVDLLSTSLFAANYLLAPLGIIWIVSNTPSSVRGLAALLGVPAIWMLPAFTAALLTGAIYPMHGENTKTADIDWVFGILIGTTALTAVWFLPLWENHWPSLAGTFASLRVSSMFDSLWLIGLSWLASIPLMVSISLGTATDNIKEKSSKLTQKQLPETSSNAQNKEEDQTKNEVTQDSDDSNHEQPLLLNLDYGWEPAPDVKFRDVGGQEELKKEIERSILRPLTRIDAAYERFNVSAPNGILLYGPPGTGKTLFARAIAGELGHPYLELSAGDIKSRWINQSTEQVNQLFDEAEQFDRCVIFIDEIDALLADRGNGLHREHAQVVNEFLAHLDDDPNFLVIAATNRPDLLDEAAIRRGRFDHQYEVGLPDEDARKAIFHVQLRDRPTDLDAEDYEELAERTADFTAAEIVGIVDDAAMHAAERNAEAITRDHLLSSFSELSSS